MHKIAFELILILIHEVGIGAGSDSITTEIMIN